MVGFAYDYDWAAYFEALRRRIPVWIRMETQDEAFSRARSKAFGRSLLYRLIYLGISKAFFIGKLNREHYRRHGIPERKLVRSPYCTVDRVGGDRNEEKIARRQRVRELYGWSESEVVVGFFGKFISKKNPDLILDAIHRLGDDNVVALLVGSGELESQLRQQAEALGAGRVAFPGFVNQTALPDYYLATDILVLPSLRMGETWGLVVNEALQAGCAVVMTETVGSCREFEDLERVRVIRQGDVRPGKVSRELSAFPRSFQWAQERMKAYSVEVAAEAIAAEIHQLALHS